MKEAGKGGGDGFLVIPEQTRLAMKFLKEEGSKNELNSKVGEIIWTLETT